MLRKNKDKDKEKESRQTVLIDQSVIQRDWEDREFVEVRDAIHFKLSVYNLR